MNRQKPQALLQMQMPLMQKEQKNLENIFLPGSYPEKMMPTIYQRSSCLLVTLANHEIFSLTIPNKIQGYLATGRPIIGSLNGAGAGVISNAGAGFVAPAENPSILAKLILATSKMSQTSLDELGRNGKHYFMTHFEHELLMGQLDDIFKGLARS
jgi:glycosyltransferase involved in cell wall biosynthesis